MKIPYPVIQLGFILTTLISYGILLRHLKKSLQHTSFTEQKKKNIFSFTIAALVAWGGITAVLSLSGFFGDFSTFPPRIIIVLIVPLISIVWMLSTKTTGEILKHVPADKLVGLQSFRIVVEILLWMLFIDNLLPVQMTFEGRNPDVLSGLTAPIVGLLIARKKIARPALIAWHVVCLALLVNIVAIAILSMPTPFRQFMNEPTNTVVATFPVVWLPAFLVPLAYGLHFLSLRQLFIVKDE